jgi:transposase
VLGSQGRVVEPVPRALDSRRTARRNPDRFLRREGASLRFGWKRGERSQADALLDQVASAEIIHGDKGYDTNAVRQKIEAKGAAPNIPPKVNRVWKNCFSPCLYQGRNAIERMFNRLKDFRRIATRYDRLAINFHAAVCIAAIVSYWL